MEGLIQNLLSGNGQKPNFQAISDAMKAMGLTDPDASHAQDSSDAEKSPEFLTLPREIRDTIYAYVFCTSSIRWIKNRTITPVYDKPVMPGLSLLRVSKQINAKATSLLKRGRADLSISRRRSFNSLALPFKTLKLQYRVLGGVLDWEGDHELVRSMRRLISEVARAHKGTTAIPPVTLHVEFVCKGASLGRPMDPFHGVGRVLRSQNHRYTNGYKDRLCFYRAQLLHLVPKMRDALDVALPGAVLTTNVEKQNWPECVKVERVDGWTVKFKDEFNGRMGYVEIRDPRDGDEGDMLHVLISRTWLEEYDPSASLADF